MSASQNTLNLTFPGVLGESMLIALDLEGVEVSMGSACAAGAVEPSHVLLAMGRDARRSAQLAYASASAGAPPRTKSRAPARSSRASGGASPTAEPISLAESAATTRSGR